MPALSGNERGGSMLDLSSKPELSGMSELSGKPNASGCNRHAPDNTAVDNLEDMDHASDHASDDEGSSEVQLRTMRCRSRWQTS